MYDVAVIGAGFGGLGAALRLAEGGARVVLVEALTYPGGCASTFTRRGYRFEAGATLFSGLGEGQLFDNWIRTYDLDVEVDFIDPLIELRAPFGNLEVGQRKAKLVEALCERDPARADSIRAFFDAQGRAADLLWRLFDDPSLLPPIGARALLSHARTSLGYLGLARDVGRPLSRWFDRYGLNESRPFMTWANATSQITLQCAADVAEAPFALASLDYPFRGTGHVVGGIGSLATGLVHAVEKAGGDVRYARRVKRIARVGDGFSITTIKDELRAKTVVANLLPRALNNIVEKPLPVLEKKSIADGWGAVMLYRVCRAPSGAPKGAHHLELVLEDGPFVEGNHVFLSISGANEDRGCAPGERTITASTHLAIDRLRADDPASVVDEVQQRMRETIAVRAPEWCDCVFEMTASPRTFERFVGRPEGLVGGVPRTAGLHHYRGVLERAVADNLFLVGDSVFPGQSTLAVALSGVKAAERILY